MKRNRGFTLIELLIVVAIIAILAAIAVPNFLEAQTRSKVSRVKADFRALSTALESYVVDTNYYPVGMNAAGMQTDLSWSNLTCLTTPVAYMTSVGFKDPFKPIGRFGPWLGYGVSGNTSESYLYFYLGNGFSTAKTNETWAEKDGVPATSMRKAWVLSSNGPDRCQDELQRTALGPVSHGWSDAVYANSIYDPTNGTNSGGDVGRTGGAVDAARSALINR